MNKQRKLYLAYGSNLNLGQMANRCRTATVVGVSEMKDYQFLFRGTHSGAVATVEPCKGCSVPVLVWEIARADEIALDRYEGWPFHYRKEVAKVKLNGKLIKAMVYIMNEGPPLGQPSVGYFATIMEGYRSVGFNTDILRQATENSLQEGYENDNQF